MANSVKKPVDKSKWGCFGQVPADKRKVGLDKAPVKFVKVPNRGGLTLPANAKVGKAKPITVDRRPPLRPDVNIRHCQQLCHRSLLRTGTGTRMILDVAAFALSH